MEYGPWSFKTADPPAKKRRADINANSNLAKVTKRQPNVRNITFETTHFIRVASPGLYDSA
jgi:hypothetical protein